MTMKTKEEVFQEHLQDWLKAKGSREKRGEIARHLVFVAKCHPKSVSRTFKRLQLRDSAHVDLRGRPPYYDRAVDAALRAVWAASDFACGILLHPVIGELVAALSRSGAWTHADMVTGKLHAMSERTVRRRVEAFRAEYGKRGKGHSGTSPSAVKTIIPIFKGPWSDLPPGEGQIDTVAHCGESLSGTFAWTADYADAATYWGVRRAQWNKGQEATRASIEEIERRLPFPLRHIHPDSGSEFVNWHLNGWCANHVPPIRMTRSEPYKKNDNMYVEERNGHVVRRYLGWDRFDDPAIVPLMNELYDVLDPYVNHFKAVRRMISKERVGAKYVRTYEKRAMTPYERVMTRADVAEEIKARLRVEHESLDPLLLLKKIATLKKQIYELAKASRNRATDERIQ